jgi:putative transposase
VREKRMHGLMRGDWKRGTVSGPQRLQPDAWTAPDLSATAPVLDSDPPAIRRVLPTAEHRRHKGLNTRAENSHQPTRQRERAMRRFKSPEQAQRFLGPFGVVGDHFRVGRYRTPAIARRQLLAERRCTWREVVGLPRAA